MASQACLPSLVHRILIESQNKADAGAATAIPIQLGF